jgi:membrane protein DedA with SNARE-associated domain
VEVIATLSVNIVSGLGQVSYGQYLLYESLGELVQVLIYAGLGYVLGSNWEVVNNALGKYSWVVAALFIIIMVYVWQRVLKKVKHKALSRSPK